MLQKKICMFGSPLGTRLIRECFYSIFSEKYRSTIGVAIHRKQVQVGKVDLNLLVWDLAFNDDCWRTLPSYLRGMSGYVVVEDPADEASQRLTQEFHQVVRNAVGQLPSLTFTLGSEQQTKSEKVSIGQLFEASFQDFARRVLQYDEPQLVF